MYVKRSDDVAWMMMMMLTMMRTTTMMTTIILMIEMETQSSVKIAIAFLACKYQKTNSKATSSIGSSIA